MSEIVTPKELRENAEKYRGPHGFDISRRVRDDLVRLVLRAADTIEGLYRDWSASSSPSPEYGYNHYLKEKVCPCGSDRLRIMFSKLYPDGWHHTYQCVGCRLFLLAVNKKGLWSWTGPCWDFGFRPERMVTPQTLREAMETISRRPGERSERVQRLNQILGHIETRKLPVDKRHPYGLGESGATDDEVLCSEHCGYCVWIEHGWCRLVRIIEDEGEPEPIPRAWRFCPVCGAELGDPKTRQHPTPE